MKNKRDTSYSMTQKVIAKYGLDHIKQLWIRGGMTHTGKQLDTSPYVIRYIAQLNEWKRPASTCPHLVAGIRNGRMSAEHYKTLDFSGINLNDKKGDYNDS